MTDEIRESEDAPTTDASGREDGKTAAGETTGTRQQLDSAGGGYGSQSGTGSSGGSGDGDPGGDSSIDDGTTSAGTGATGAGPTEWLRDEDGSA